MQSLTTMFSSIRTQFAINNYRVNISTSNTSLVELEPFERTLIHSLIALSLALVAYVAWDPRVEGDLLAVKLIEYNYNPSRVEENFSSKSREVETAESDTKKDAEGELETYCLLFPTYATKTVEGKSTDQWNIRIRGWAFSAPKKSKSRNLFLGLTSLATGIKKDDERYQFLEARTSYFWASNISQGEFSLQVDGLTDSNKMSIEGDPNDDGAFSTTTAPSGEGATTTTTSVNVPDVKKVLGHAEKIITPAVAHPESENTRMQVVPKLGHVIGNMSIPKETVLKWIEEENSENIVSGFIHNFIGSKDKNRVRLLKVKAYQNNDTEPSYGVVNLVEPEGVSIISDIDDTIKDTNILQGAKSVLTNTFLQPFKDVQGMSELYRKFYEKGASIHYVSNSPWQLFPSLKSFFHTYNFPPGSSHFKFYDGLIKSAYEQKENPMASKFMYIRELLQDFPNRKFILVGDTGELDPEIYTTIARENPGRILRIYVRDVTTEHVKDLPAQKPRHSYSQTFPTIYNYLRSYYSSLDEETGTETKEEEQAEKDVVEDVITHHAVAATAGETIHHKPERKSSLTDRLLDKLHVDISYLHGTSTITESPDPMNNDDTSNKPKTPLSARILSPERAASLSSKFSKLRSTGKKNEEEDVNIFGDEEDDGVLKTPLEMFHERCALLKQGLPENLFHTFTSAKELEDDPVIREAIKF
ncbi:17042_t:CDS:2 [Funneliformis caledonium]|uniref:17042_t:CDS:1 n=1 Tax=Funneliformis caledonium TaxID=1117310 RepID=A0A9N9D6R7_9GLOM|nr:17042_t:CDS:2 [Funneliformis caledonium]